MKQHYFLILLFSLCAANAQIINIPDANFKAKLLAASPASDTAIDALNNQIKIDTNNDGEIQESEALLVAKLNVYDSGISDLTGIGYFTNLTLLNADDNQLVTVTLTGLSNLTWLRITENSSLTSVSLSNLSSLHMLELFFNQLSSLTLNGLPNLYGVYCTSNHLTTIDLSSCPMIEQVDFSQNQLTSITFPDFTTVNNPYEFIIQLDHNLLETLTLPNHLIGGFFCDNNPNLTYLNMKEGIRSVFNPNLSEYHFSNCPALEYICVRDEDITAAQGLIALYGYTNCQVGSDCQLGSETFAASDSIVYPNPVKNALLIQMTTNHIIKTMQVYNVLGQLVQVITNPNETIDVSGLKTGSYFIKIVSDKGSAAAKFIKE